MIFYHTFGGRLGNQLFQAAFVSSIARPKERVYFTKMGQVLKMLPFEFRGRSHLQGFLYKVFDRLVVPFLITPIVHTLRLVSFIREIPGTDQVERRKGLFHRIVWVEGYFQGERFFNHTKIAQWKIDPQLKEKALVTFRAMIPEKKTAIALHWRLGDYKDISVFDKKDPSLPRSYFEDAIQEIRKHIKNPFFLCFSDEPKNVASRLNLDPSEYAISQHAPEVDVLLMALCDHLILSNSTLAWWGGYWGQGPGKMIFAPKYWLGWKNGRTYPPAIEPSFATLIEP